MLLGFLLRSALLGASLYSHNYLHPQNGLLINPTLPIRLPLSPVKMPLAERGRLVSGLPLFTQLPRRGLLGNRERIFIRGCIKVPAPKVRDRGERALSLGPNE